MTFQTFTSAVNSFFLSPFFFFCWSEKVLCPPLYITKEKCMISISLASLVKKEKKKANRFPPVLRSNKGSDLG